MQVEIPLFFIVVFACMIVFSFVCTICLVIDTYVRFCEMLEDRKWADLVDEESETDESEEIDETEIFLFRQILDNVND